MKRYEEKIVYYHLRIGNIDLQYRKIQVRIGID
jgi:hypothetical protein